VSDGDGRSLGFSAMPNAALLRWEEITGVVAPLRPPAGSPDGNTRDREGRLWRCALGRRTRTRTAEDGTGTVLAASCAGLRRTGSHAVGVQADRSLWCRATGAGIRGHALGEQAEQAWPGRVSRLDPVRGALRIAIDAMERPTGLCVSPDETRLSVVDTPGGAKTTHVEDIVDGTAVNGRRFFDAMPGYAGGMRCETAGHVWWGCSGGPGQDGVAVFAPDGIVLGRMLLPARCANLCCGGRKRHRLCRTASQSVYALSVAAHGTPGGCTLALDSRSWSGRGYAAHGYQGAGLSSAVNRHVGICVPDQMQWEHTLRSAWCQSRGTHRCAFTRSTRASQITSASASKKSRGPRRHGWSSSPPEAVGSARRAPLFPSHHARCNSATK
jgi:gluconolactonase